VNCPEPGVYRGIAAEEYFAWDAVSNSKLNLMRRSAAHYKHGFNEPTAQMALGSLVHSGVLEPLSIAKRYVFMPNYAAHPDNVSKTGQRSFSSATDFVKRMQEDFQRLNHDKEIVSEDHYNTMIGMASSLSDNAVARDLFRDGQAEVSLVWDDPSSGLRCKCRIDWLRMKSAEFVDLKTTADASDFERSIAKFGYHRQMAFYQWGLFAAAGIRATPWIVAAETKAPFGCRAAQMLPESIEIGRQEVQELLQQVADCLESDEWPGYPNPTSWGLPEWYLRTNEQPVELLIGGESLTV
jgi:hypothetical protein